MNATAHTPEFERDGAAGMVEAVLQETLELLDRFAREGAEAAIDLAGMPLTKDERDELERRLGRGEVEAELAVLGRSEVWDTAYSGVWWVRHWGEERISSEAIEITAVPKILICDRDDARAAAARLARALSTSEESKDAGATHE